MNKKILQLALPSIVSNITVPLLGLVDVAITGHMGEARYMAAIAVGSMMFNVIYWLFAFLRFGTGGLTAQAYGEASSQTKALTAQASGKAAGIVDANELSHGSECRNMLMRALATSTLMALALIILQAPLFQLMMWIIAPDATLIGTIHTYYDILIWGTIPSLSLYAFTGWFVGMQNTKLPMVISITQNICNILLSLILVYCLHMKIEGVASGTLIAQWAGMAMAAVMVRWRYGWLWHGERMTWHDVTSGLNRFFSVNRIIFFRTLFIVAVNVFFIQAGAKGGEVMLAVNSVLMQMFILYSYVMDGFAFAAEALCGRYYGAHDTVSFHRALRGVWLWGLALTAAYTIAYAAGGNIFLSLLTDDNVIRHAAIRYMPWTIAIPFCGIMAFIWDGVFVGTTDTRGMLMATFGGTLTFFIIYLTLYPTLANHALWLAFCVYLLMRGIVQHLRWHFHTRLWLIRATPS